MPPRRRRRLNGVVEELNENQDENPDPIPDPNVNTNPDLIQTFVELLCQTLQNPPLNQTQDTCNFKVFQDANPTEFSGTTGPTKVQSWVREIEKAFEIVKVRNDQKTIFATYMLKDEANFWWEAKKGHSNLPVVPWERFKEVFFEKYYPKYMSNMMELKFLELKQDNMRVAEYETKFTELSRFVPYYVDTEEKRARKFEQGLKPWIYNKVAVLEISNYAQLVHKAAIVESGNELYLKAKEDKKRKFEKGDGSSFSKKFCKEQDVGVTETGNNRNPYAAIGNQNNRTASPQPSQVRKDNGECRNCGKKQQG